MSHALFVGGVSYSVEAADAVEIVTPDPVYEPFREAPFMPIGVSIVPVEVAIQRGFSEPPIGGQLLFDTDQSWFVQRDGKDLVFILRGPNGPGDLLWSARLAGDRSRVSVHCGSRFWTGDSSVVLHDPFVYPLDQLVTMMVLAHQRRGAVVHAAGAVLKERAIACIGVSGAGKSTLAALLDGRASVSSDDRVVLRVSDGETVLFGTPWSGEAGFARQEAASLAALVFLHKAETTEIHPVTRHAALRQLLPTISVPWFEERAASDVLAAAEHILDTVPAFELHFTPELGVEEVLARIL